MEEGLVPQNSTCGVVQVVEHLNKGIFAHPGITYDEEVHMAAMVLIFTRPVPAHHFFGVFVQMLTISISFGLSRGGLLGAPRSSPLPITVSPVSSPFILAASGPIISNSVCLGTLVVADLCGNSFCSAS